MEAVVEGLRNISAVDVDFMPHDLDVGSGDASLLVSSGTATCNGTTRRKIYVRLLLSIDRRETTEAAMETVCRKIRFVLKEIGRLFFSMKFT